MNFSKKYKFKKLPVIEPLLMDYRLEVMWPEMLNFQKFLFFFYLFPELSWKWKKKKKAENLEKFL